MIVMPNLKRAEQLAVRAVSRGAASRVVDSGGFYQHSIMMVIFMIMLLVAVMMLMMVMMVIFRDDDADDDNEFERNSQSTAPHPSFLQHCSQQSKVCSLCLPCFSCSLLLLGGVIF